MGDGPVVDEENSTLASELGAHPKRAQELLRAKLR
jgi:hypothetical protein